MIAQRKIKIFVHEDDSKGEVEETGKEEEEAADSMKEEK
jgi:hypothetical protein